MKRTIRRFAALGVLTAILAAASMPSMAQNTHSLPLVLPDGGSQAGFVRIGNRSGQSGTVRILAIDDTGEQFGPVTLSLDANETVNFNSRDLEQGNESKGLSAGVGDGSGYWRLILDTALNISPLAYIRTSDGFVTAMHDVAPETEADSRRYRVVFLNPGSNMRQVSRLRLINPGSTTAEVTITGRDDAGDDAPGGTVRLNLPARSARTLTAQTLEAGTGLDGRLGDGAGKWSLTVSSNVDIQVMSLLRSPTGHLANLSTAPMHAGMRITIPEEPEPPIPPEEPNIDIAVSNAQARRGNGAFMVGISIMNVGDVTVHPSVYTLTATFVEPDGSYGLPFLTYGFRGREIEPHDFVTPRFTRTVSINNNTPVVGATVRICIEPVPGETMRTNNCMTATVRSVDDTTPPEPPTTGHRYGAVAATFLRCSAPFTENKFASSIEWDHSSQSVAVTAALRVCNSKRIRQGGSSRPCRIIATFGTGFSNNRTCGALAYGNNSSRCWIQGGRGSSLSDAESHALNLCRNVLGTNCSLPISDGRFAKCATTANAAQEKQISEGESHRERNIQPQGIGRIISRP